MLARGIISQYLFEGETISWYLEGKILLPIIKEYDSKIMEHLNMALTLVRDIFLQNLIFISVTQTGLYAVLIWLIFILVKKEDARQTMVVITQTTCRAMLRNSAFRLKDYREHT